MAEDIIEDAEDDFDDELSELLGDDLLEEDDSEDILAGSLDDDSEDILGDSLDDDLDEDESDEDLDDEDIADLDMDMNSGKPSPIAGIVAKIKDIGSKVSKKIKIPPKLAELISKLPLDAEKIKGLIQIITASVKNMVIAAVSFVVLLVLFITVLIFMFSSEPEVAPDELHPVVNQEEGIPAEEIIFEEIVELEPFERLPLRTKTTMGSVSINLSLELIDPANRQSIYSSEERIRQIVADQVQNMTWIELRNPDGKILLKYKMLKRINEIFPEPIIRNIYFTYFIMQR